MLIRCCWTSTGTLLCTILVRGAGAGASTLTGTGTKADMVCGCGRAGIGADTGSGTGGAAVAAKRTQFDRKINRRKLNSKINGQNLTAR